MSNDILNFPTNNLNKNINISPEDIKCPKCKNEIFEQKLKIKRVSPIQSPTGEEMIIPIPVILCDKCGYEMGNEEKKETKIEGTF